MRICLIGEFSGHLDEGMRILSSRIAEQLSREHEVRTLDVRDVKRTQFWRAIRGFSPEIVHYIHGPTILSLAMMKAIALWCGNPKTLVSATHPYLPKAVRGIVPLLKPTLVLTQSYESERLLTNCGCRTTFLPSGVDTERFRPVTHDVKRELRQKHGLDENKFVVLHVGSIRKKRNISLLAEMQGDDTQVVIVGSTSTGVEEDVLQNLKERGCLLWTSYFENIEEIYWLSDCYAFPTRRPLGAIEVPLSVLEAMACNLPVISTPFGALPRLLQHGEGLFFADGDRDFSEYLRTIKTGSTKINTRDKVLPYSWDKVVAKLEDIYRDLLRESQAGVA